MHCGERSTWIRMMRSRFCNWRSSTSVWEMTHTPRDIASVRLERTKGKQGTRAVNEPNNKSPNNKLTARQDQQVDHQDAMLRLLDRPLDEADVRAATLRVEQPLTVSDRDLVSLLAFRVNEELFGLPGEDVVRVTGVPSIHRVPHRTNAVIRGLCCVQGELLISVSLPALLGMPEPEPADTAATGDQAGHRRMVVIGREAETWAVVLGVMRLEASSFLPPPATVQNARQCFTRNLAPLPDGRMVAVLDASRLDSGFKAALS
jgi:chemotaxis-related protein WspD